MKICKKCNVEKKFTCFANSKKGDKFGLHSYCKECRREICRNWHKKNAKKSKEIHDNWLAKNPDKVKAYSKKWISENIERHKENNRSWKLKNPSLNAKNSNNYRVSKTKQTPKWLSFIEFAQIQEMYDVAQALYVQTGIKHHVDHIHPLKGNGFNGLHVPWNLQILTASENIAKKNKIPQDEKHIFWGVS